MCGGSESRHLSRPPGGSAAPVASRGGKIVVRRQDRVGPVIANGISPCGRADQVRVDCLGLDDAEPCDHGGQECICATSHLTSLRNLLVFEFKPDTPMLETASHQTITRIQWKFSKKNAL